MRQGGWPAPFVPVPAPAVVDNIVQMVIADGTAHGDVAHPQVPYRAPDVGRYFNNQTCS